VAFVSRAPPIAAITYHVRRESRWAAPLSDGGELRFLNGWAIGGRFDGEFADRAQTYANR